MSMLNYLQIHFKKNNRILDNFEQQPETSTKAWHGYERHLASDPSENAPDAGASSIRASGAFLCDFIVILSSRVEFERFLSTLEIGGDFTVKANRCCARFRRCSTSENIVDSDFAFPSM